MKALIVIIVIINLFACAANRPSELSKRQSRMTLPFNSHSIMFSGTNAFYGITAFKLRLCPDRPDLQMACFSSVCTWHSGLIPYTCFL